MKKEGWSSVFAAFAGLFIILSVVGLVAWCFWPEDIMEGEVQVNFAPLLAEIKNLNESDYVELGLEIPHYDENGKRVGGSKRYYICDNQDEMRKHVDDFGITYYQYEGQLPMANDVCYFYMMINGKPNQVKTKLGTGMDAVVVFTLQGIYEEEPPYNADHNGKR